MGNMRGGGLNRKSEQVANNGLGLGGGRGSDCPCKHIRFHRVKGTDLLLLQGVYWVSIILCIIYTGRQLDTIICKTSEK